MEKPKESKLVQYVIVREDLMKIRGESNIASLMAEAISACMATIKVIERDEGKIEMINPYFSGKDYKSFVLGISDEESLVKLHEKLKDNHIVHEVKRHLGEDNKLSPTCIAITPSSEDVKRSYFDELFQIQLNTKND